jgi:hypothetical protein
VLLVLGFNLSARGSKCAASFLFPNCRRMCIVNGMRSNSKLYCIVRDNVLFG